MTISVRGSQQAMAYTAIFDVDGTLVDTNYQHALAWFRAFRRYGITRPMWRIHRGIGMGGDMFVPEVGGRDVEQEHGDDLREAWGRNSTNSSATSGPSTARTSCWPRSNASLRLPVAFRQALDGTPLARASR